MDRGFFNVLSLSAHLLPRLVRGLCSLYHILAVVGYILKLHIGIALGLVVKMRRTRVAALSAGQHDTMDPKHMEWMATQFPEGRYLHCPEGSHMAFYDDQKTYFEELVEFMKEVDG